MSVTIHRLLAAAVLSALCAFGAHAAPAATAQATYQFNLPEQSLADALRAIGRQTTLNILFSPESVENIRVPALRADLTAVEAISRVLAGTRLQAQQTTANTIMVSPADAKKKTDKSAMTGMAPAHEDARVALADTDAARKTDGVEEMLVEGEREKPAPFSTANLDLTRTEDEVLPFTVFTARDIQLSGAVNLQEFFQNRLPQNFNPSLGDESGTVGYDETLRSNRVDMRGWGEAETVFLLNGRRMGMQYQGVQSDASNATPDLELIPLGSIERVEVLTSAGSAIYGSNATGGVINIITRQDYRGGQLSVTYESPADVHRPKRGIDFSYGLPLKWGVSARFSGGYRTSEPLRVGDRAAVTIERWRALILQRDPIRLVDTNDPFAFPPWGATPNIHSTSAESLYGAIGGTAFFTSVPDGYRGGQGLAAFEDRQGVYNLALAEGEVGGFSVFARDATLGVGSANTSLGLGFDKNFGERWRWSVDYRYARDDDDERTNSSALFLSNSAFIGGYTEVPGTAAINPFDTDVMIRLVDPRLARPELRNASENVTYEVTSTLRAEFGAWRAFADAGFSQHRGRLTDESFFEPTGGWAEAFNAGRYNPFVDLRAVAPATADFYSDYVAVREQRRSATRTYLSSIKASGPLRRLPAGDLQLTAGVDWMRVDRYQSFLSGQYQDGLTGEARTPAGLIGLDGDVSRELEPLQNIFVLTDYAGYTEVDAPLVGSAMNMPLIRRLNLFASARRGYNKRDGFRSDGRPVEYSVRPHVHALGLRYEPAEGIALRASTSIGFKPPTIGQITPANPPPVSNVITVRDPRRGNQTRQLNGTQRINGGNPNLLPETTDSGNFGLIFTPRWQAGLRVSVDYIENVRNDAISGISAQDMINFEGEFPGRVQRGAPDGHFSGVGPITFLDFRAVNLRRILSRSVDFSVEQQLENVFGGRLRIAAAASHNLSFKVQTSNTAPPEEQVRNPGGIYSRRIEWNANGQVEWQGQRWGMGWGLQFFDYIPADPFDYIAQGADRAPWKINHDLFVNYSTPLTRQARGQWWLSGLSLVAGVKNVFDREPRFWASEFDRGVAPYDSITGRSFWLQLRKSF